MSKVILHEEFVIKAVGEILSRATKSAIQLNNFPLSNVDIGCAFDNYVHEKMLTDSVAYSLVDVLKRLGFEI